MKYEVKYVGNNETVNLMKSPYLCKDIQTLFENELKYNSTNSIFDSRIYVNNFYFEGTETNLNIQIIGKNKAGLINKLEHVFNYDCSLLKPGKLYVNDYYAYCYFISSSPENFDRFLTFESISYKILFCSNWIKEEKFDFIVDDDFETKTGFKYPFSYPFSYKAVKRDRYINNSHFSPCRASIVFYGPCTNPEIKISGLIYRVEAELLKNERIEIDPFEKTVIKYTEDGTKLDYMNYRYKKTSVFTPIPVGLCLYEANSKFSCRVTLYMERGTPEWK